MPLLDHFHMPMMEELAWSALHSSWASDIARARNRTWLPRRFRASEQTHVGPRIGIDVVTLERFTPPGGSATTNGGAIATAKATYMAPPVTSTESLSFPDCFEVRVYEGPGSWQLVAAIELISPGNLDREDAHRAFVSKC